MRIAAGYSDHGVVGVIGERQAAVIAIGDALTAGGAVERGDNYIIRSGFKPAGVCRINDRTARPNPISIPVGIDRFWQFLPMHHVWANRVAPSPLSSVGAEVQLVGIMLVVEVILTIVINHPVHVVDQAPSAGIMNLWPQ